MASSLEARLSYLETREEATTKDVLRLKNDNVELQTKVFELKEEKSQVVMKLKEMDAKSQRLTNLLSEVFCYDDIINRLNCLENKVKSFKDINDRLSNLETSMNLASQRMNSQSQSITERLDALEKQQNRLDNRMFNRQIDTPLKATTDGAHATKQKNAGDLVQSLADRLECIGQQDVETGDRLKTIESEVKGMKQESSRHKQSVTSRLDSVEKKMKELTKEKEKFKEVENDVAIVKQEATANKQTFTGRFGVVEKQAQGILDNLRALQTRNAKYSQSVSGVRLKLSQALKTGQYVKIDESEGTVHNGGDFDTSSCCLQPQVEGLYMVHVVFMQNEDGLILVRANNKRENAYYFGQTSSQNDVCSCVHMISMRKGQKFWLEASRIEGNAELGWCYLYCWLL